MQTCDFSPRMIKKKIIIHHLRNKKDKKKQDERKENDRQLGFGGATLIKHIQIIKSNLFEETEIEENKMREKRESIPRIWRNHINQTY